MKCTIYALIPALILSVGGQVHADSLFSRVFNSGNQQNVETVSGGQQGASPFQLTAGPTAPVVPVAHNGYFGAEGAQPCLDGCDPHGSECDSCWLPGTGAFGGDSPFAATLEFNQDAFFGTYIATSGGYAMNEFTDFTFYAILWNTDFFSQGPGGLNGPVGIDGIGLWTEFGAGVNFKYMGGALNINPQFGVLNGALLSGIGGDGFPKAFEGVVPNLTINYNDTFLESELYMGYYIGTRGAREGRAEFLHWWYNAGIKPWGDYNDWRQIVSTGLHYEQLRSTGRAVPGGLYQWLGPYVQFSLPNGLAARFSAGWDVDRQNFGDDFYKVNLTYSF